MAHKKYKKHQAHISSPLKVQEEPLIEKTPAPTEKIPASNKESFISIFLGALIVIIIGVIVYNYFSGLNKKNIPPTVAPSPKISEEVSQPTMIKGKIISYKVASGDSLWTIAEKFYNDGYKWTEIAKINKLTNPDEIEVGMTLSISEPTVKQGAITPAAVSTVGPKAITGKVYKVSVGDDLWDIAVRACGDGYKWPLLATSNKLENPDIIHPGNIFKIKCK